jgi:adenosylhomocysteinase
MRIAVSVHVEAKTACLAKVLAAGGADVALTGCNPLSTQDDVAAALAADGMHVYCVHGAGPGLYHEHLSMALSFGPDIVIDDGGDFAQLLHTSHRHLTDRLIGGCEETTTGVHRLAISRKREPPSVSGNRRKRRQMQASLDTDSVPDSRS